MNSFPSPKAVPSAPRNRRTGKRPVKKRPLFSPLQAGVLLLLLLLVVCAILALGQAQRSINALTVQRESEAQAYAREVGRHQVAYQDLIEYYSAVNCIDPAYVAAIIKRESDYDPGAVSRVNARGLMQIMPDTGEWLAKKVDAYDYDSSMLFDPETSIKMGCWYLGYLSGQFHGDPILVACAYHAGQGNVRSWLEKYSSDDQTLSLEQIPMEDTQYYAGKVLNAYAIYQQHYY